MTSIDPTERVFADPFDAAAMDAAEKRSNWDDEQVAFVDGARWALQHLAAPEPTDAEVQAAAEATADAAEGIEEWDSLTSSEQRAYRSEAGADLSAARAALAEGGDER